MIQQTIAPFRVRNRVQAAPALCVTSVKRVQKPPLRSVLTYGAFDGFHTGHARWLGQLASLGSDLVVGCATDAFCDQMGRPSKASFDARRAVLESCRFVSRVIALESWDQRLTDIVNYNISVFAVRNGMGPDMDALSDIVQVVHLPSDLPPTWVEPLVKSA
jgi:glycerol-3-phosphate cytidylyltransferase